MGRSRKPEEPLKLTDTQVMITSLPLQYTKCGEAAVDMLLLRLGGASLTATESKLALTDPNGLLDLTTSA
jgi:hypothetical protein